MESELASIAEANGGYLLRRHLNEIGVSDAMIRRLCGAKVLVRIRHGTYVPTASWRLMNAVERNGVTTRSVIERMGSTVVASHASAAALHGLDLWGVDLSVVHVTRTDGRGGRQEAGVVVHEGALVEGDLVELPDGTIATSPVRAAVETCTIASLESGMVLGSSLLRRDDVDREELEEMGARAERWQHARTARLAIRLSDGLLESVLEARSLFLMWRASIPRPELQHRFVLDGGRNAYVDFWWELFRHVGECDGAVKYGHLNPHPDDPARVLIDEKLREDAIRSSPAGVSRWGSVDLAGKRREALACRLEAQMWESRRLYTGNATHVDLGA